MEVFSFIESSKLHDEAVINQMNLRNLIDTVSIISELLPCAEYDNSTLFDFSTNRTLQGGSYPCSALECRFNQLDRTMRFAGLYAERMVFINNFDAAKRRMSDRVTKESLNHEKQDLYSNIQILYHLRPAIEMGIIRYAPYQHVCKHCLNQYILDNRADLTSFKEMEELIRTKYLENVHVVYEKYRRRGFLRHIGPEPLIPSCGYYKELSSKERGLLKNEIALMDGVEIGNDVVNKLGLYDRLISETFNNILMGNLFFSEFGTKNLTDNEFEFQVNNSFAGPEMTLEAMDVLEHGIPFIFDVDVNTIFKLRQEENDAFNSYRDAVKNALKSVKATESRAEKIEAFSDIIRPGLANVEKGMRNQQTALRKSLKNDLVVAAGSLFIAANNTMFDPTFSQYIAAAGVTFGMKSAFDCFIKGKSAFEDSNAVTDDPFYFLWKVQKESYKI